MSACGFRSGPTAHGVAPASRDITGGTVGCRPVRRTAMGQSQPSALLSGSRCLTASRVALPVHGAVTTRATTPELPPTNQRAGDAHPERHDLPRDRGCPVCECAAAAAVMMMMPSMARGSGVSGSGQAGSRGGGGAVAACFGPVLGGLAGLVALVADLFFNLPVGAAKNATTRRSSNWPASSSGSSPPAPAGPACGITAVGTRLID